MSFVAFIEFLAIVFAIVFVHLVSIGIHPDDQQRIKRFIMLSIRRIQLTLTPTLKGLFRIAKSDRYYRQEKRTECPPRTVCITPPVLPQ